MSGGTMVQGTMVSQFSHTTNPHQASYKLNQELTWETPKWIADVFGTSADNSVWPPFATPSRAPNNQEKRTMKDRVFSSSDNSSSEGVRGDFSLPGWFAVLIGLILGGAVLFESSLGEVTTVPDMRAFPLLWGLTFFSAVRADEGALREKYAWKEVDFAFPTPEARSEAIQTKKFIPSNNLPLGVDVWNGRTFVTLPKWKPGIPATLAVIPKNSDPSPLLYPYPNWKWHSEGNCNGLTSVFRISIDQCGRLWVLDSGTIDVLNTTTQLCPSQIVVFDLKTDKLIWRYRIPKDQVPEGALFTNIVTDIRNNKCDEAFAYVADVLRYGVVVYNWKEDRSWRVSHNYFYPDPIACRYKLDNITFRWTDGIFGLALSPLDTETNERFLYFHPMSSYREFSVPTSILRNDSADNFPEEFKVLGEPRGIKNRHSSASGMDRNGILFYNLVTQDAVGCWNSNRPYKQSYQGLVAKNSETLNFPNDLKVDHERRQNLWVLSNKLHKYIYTSLNPDEVNFRVLTGRIEDLVRGTVCDPSAEPLPETDNRVAQCFDAED